MRIMYNFEQKGKYGRLSKIIVPITTEEAMDLSMEMHKEDFERVEGEPQLASISSTREGGQVVYACDTKEEEDAVLEKWDPYIALRIENAEDKVSIILKN